MLTDEHGYYFFRTVKPGAYPFRNRVNSWRPAHIHFSVFGTGFAQRLITQMYFEGDPLIPHDSIIATIPDKSAADRLTARLDLNASPPLDGLAYRFNIVFRGRRQNLFENNLQGGSNDTYPLHSILSAANTITNAPPLRSDRSHPITLSL